MAAGDDRGHGGNAGYDDQIDAYYSWDSNVPNHTKLTVGDPVAVWDKRRLLGISVIEQIDRRPGIKALSRCPRCGTTRISIRKSARPLHRCMKCHREFDVPDVESVEVTEYVARYDAAWTWLTGVLGADEIKAVAVNPKEFNAMRLLDWTALERALLDRDVPRAVGRVTSRVDIAHATDDGIVVDLPHGHTTALVRVRRGQSRFREQTLRRQGSVCAFTGDAPDRVLEAGHLYSYARLGEHHEHGGLMLRRDVHRLFDDGLLSVDPDRLRVDVGDDLQRYPQYAELHQRTLTVPVHDRQIEWLAQHWAEHRT
ncbi:HNH endonuclease [Phycicoccus sp. BSK3Z-2]|uniref:HNH endonuclease n=1 Tax=Phycicoccus avicenniae TaxID=2828860 RepID=A0A941D8R0_9MICO|nr:HNH endonuclease signature motif containing protein [Phycicoccus avicenniae]MBR7742562.1 HNH endonuclease [Phycicoccus avicenniae]